MPRKKRVSILEIERKSYEWLNAISEGDLEKTKALYEQYPYIDINTLSINGNALHIALTTYENQEVFIDYLVSLGVNLEAKKYNNGWTPLFTAANYSTNNKNLDALLKHKPDIHVKAHEHHSASSILHMFAEDKNIEKLRQFINLGVNPYSLNKNKENILHIACQSNWTPMVKYLLEPQFNFDLELIAQDYKGNAYTAMSITNQKEIKDMLQKRQDLDKIAFEKSKLEGNIVNKKAKINKIKI